MHIFENKRNIKKRNGFISCLIVVCGILLVGCATKVGVDVEDIVSQKPVEEGRTPITVMIKYAFSIRGFEAAVEEKFPDVDIVQIGNYTRDMGVAEYERRMKNDDLTDIVMTWPLEVGEEYWAARLLDLSGYDFTARYNLPILNDIARDGKLFYLPGPSQVRGIIYNKTLFEEKGWKVPQDFEGFVTLCKTIEESGMRSLQLGFENAEVLDTAFIGYNYGECFSKPKDIQWIADYNAGKGSFGDHFGSALDVFERMIREGIWKPEDLEIGYAERENMLFTRQCAMVEDSVLMARMGESLTGTTDKFALMPFLNPGENSDWARLYMVCYIGVNKHLAEPQNKEKHDLVMQIMDYISSPEGQEALALDTGAMYSSLSGVEPPNAPETAHLISPLSQGRYAVFPQLKNAMSALREGLAGMIKGELSKEEVIAMVDAQNLAPVVIEPEEVLGQATADFSLIETGNFVTDAMREWSGCDMALFMDNGKDGLYNGKGISAKIYAGELTKVDIQSVLPDLKHGEKCVVWKVTMTGEDLLKTLEYAIPVDNNQLGWFYYFSGMKMKFNPLAEPGSRIKTISLPDGEPIKPAKFYTIAVMDDTVPDSFIQEIDKTNQKISNILEEAIKEKGSISPSEDGRFQIIK